MKNEHRQAARLAARTRASRLSAQPTDGTERRTVRAEGKNWYPRWSADGRALLACSSSD